MNNKKMKMKPLVKCAGGKTSLLPVIKEFLPKEFNDYYEVCVGSGALFLALALSSRVFINDLNTELIAVYRCMKDEVLYKKMIKELEIHERNHCEDYYYKIREYDRLEGFNLLPLHVVAARFIYLNKSCFNGLYRVNKKGWFNTPWNKQDTVKLFEKSNIEEIHKYFLNNEIQIFNEDFEKVALMANEGDFVFLDTPYDKLGSKTFTDYTKLGFTKEDQIRTAKCVKKLTEKGVKVLATNHDTPLTRELYKEYNINTVTVNRNINCNAKARKDAVQELIITNYDN